MIAVLIGHQDSQRIVPASKYLTEKYLSMISTVYLNYKGGINGWAEYVASFLKYLNDPYVIFALDDYLVADFIDLQVFAMAQSEIKSNHDVVCVKLCNSTPEEHAEYPITTQYCIWDRIFLIWLLEQVHSPWDFEVNGSGIFRTNLLSVNKKVLLMPCIDYFTNSSLSGRWEGVRLDGLKEKDILTLKENGLL